MLDLKVAVPGEHVEKLGRTMIEPTCMHVGKSYNPLEHALDNGSRGKTLQLLKDVFNYLDLRKNQASASDRRSFIERDR